MQKDSDVKKISKTLAPLERKVLPCLKDNSNFDDVVKASGLKDVEVMRALQWLANKGAVRVDEQVKEVVDLDKNGQSYRKNSLPEKRFLLSIKDKESTADDLIKKAQLAKEELDVCIGLLKKKGFIDIKKIGKDLVLAITELGKKSLSKSSFEELFLARAFPVDISLLKDEERFAFDELKKRKNIVRTEIKKIRTISLTELGKELIKLKVSSDVIEGLTPEIIRIGGWKGKEFREYDVKSKVPDVFGGKRHFVNQAADYARKIWTELGFKEMTGTLTQTSFWNFDALFTAQDHPVREMQDTFYVKDVKGKLLDSKIVDAVKKSHECGADKSRGWQYKWKEDDAKKVVLRTHTTCLSAKTLAELRNKKQIAGKFFSVGKCFRNETVDWSHGFEFNQTEGIVVDKDVTFRHLLGYLKEFFRKMGFEKVRFRPSYFPYTEPSVEIEVFHPERKVWFELGGAGVFRPEVTIPLLGEKIPVLAWGPGFDRSIMDYYGIKFFKEIYQNDLAHLRKMKFWME